MDWASRVYKFVALDLETHLIEPGRLAPQIVCGSAATVDGGGRLLARDEVTRYARSLLDSDAVIVGANVVFDFGCLAVADPELLPLIFRAYAEERVYDIQIAQALDAIAHGVLYLDPVTRQPMRGRYSLDTCVKLVLGRDDAKANDYWRMRYALLENTPIEEWPTEARQYPVDDAINTLEVALCQVLGGGAGPVPGPLRNLGDLAAQCETMWALHLGAMWGIRTDPDRVAELRAKTEKAHKAFVEKFQALGFFSSEGKRNNDAVKRAVILAYGGGGPCSAGCVGGRVLSEKTGNPVKCKACSGTGLDPGPTPRTPAGGVCADRDALMQSGDEHLIALGDNEAEKILNTYLPWLEEGTTKPITLRPNVLVASGRTSYDGLVQLVQRDGGVRECFLARPGHVFVSVDYSAGELCTLAQVNLWLFKRSQMAETINASGDPGVLHSALAASMCGWTTEQMVAALKSNNAELKQQAKDFRQAAKAANFGFPGGMGAAKLVLAKRKKNEGTTTGPDGRKYSGIRFCLLVGGAERCGEVLVRDYYDGGGNLLPPFCKKCFDIANDQIRPAWFKQWPEMRAYFSWVQDQVEHGGEFPCFGTGRVRGGLDFPNGANNGFQALLADAAKYALRAVTRECHVDAASPMYGTTHPIFFTHDEVVAEMREDVAHLAAPRMAELMVAAARTYVPDVCMVAEPALMRAWTKKAEPAYAPDGRLIVWEEEKKSA
jgi:DNA polymerase-1